MSATHRLPAVVSEAQELISVARIVRPQGRRGEVIADLFTDFPDRFADLGLVRIKRSSGAISDLKLESSRPHKGRIVLKFAGYDSIDQAEDLRDAQVMITRDQLVRLPEDVYYDFELIGCDVLTARGDEVGRVTDVRHFGAAPLLAVRDKKDEREHLIPLALSICVEIDVAHKRIVVNPPEGLLEL